MAAPRPRDLPDSLHHRMVSLEREARLDRGARVPLAVAEDRQQVIQSAALVSGWNTLVTASVTWPAWASQALITVKGSIALTEAPAAPDVYGGALKVVTNGTEGLESLCFGVYDNRGATGNYTNGNADDGLLITTPAATVDALLKFYPWNEGWYPGAADSRAACHLLVTFLH